uniref:Uncharacterized protein n=1 Tax=Glossina austeni TaxID=7395 RepID=A0A1A9UMS4_GLOAU
MKSDLEEGIKNLKTAQDFDITKSPSTFDGSLSKTNVNLITQSSIKIQFGFLIHSQQADKKVYLLLITSIPQKNVSTYTAIRPEFCGAKERSFCLRKFPPTLPRYTPMRSTYVKPLSPQSDPPKLPQIASHHAIITLLLMMATVMMTIMTSFMPFDVTDDRREAPPL